MLKRYFLVFVILGFFMIGCQSKRPSAYHQRKPQTERPAPHRPPVIPERPAPPVSKPDTEVVHTPTPANIPYNERVSLYISEYAPIAKEEMTHYGIPASIKLGQAILESGAGAGSLAVRSNNHFGIKCHTGWQGDRVYHDDDEKGECFRKYNHPKYSFRDHSLFLTQRPRYRDLFSLRKDDYKGWARGLKRAGYATDPRYPEKLIGIIERYDLQKYDREVLTGKVEKTERSDEPSRVTSPEVYTYTVKQGDTLFNISQRFNLTVDTLKQYNGLVDDVISIGQTLYLHPIEN